MSEQDSNQESGNQDNKPKLLRTWLRENTGGWWVGFVLEAALIVFSVLLALAVNEWRAERTRAQKAQTALEAIRSELESNKEKFTGTMKGHRDFRDTLRYYQERDMKPPMKLLGQGIFNPATVSNTAWETAKQAGVTDHFDYELVLDLSSLYRRQAEYKALGNAIGQDFYVKATLEVSSKELLQDNFENWIMLLGDFSRREENFEEYYNEMLQRIDNVIDDNT